MPDEAEPDDPGERDEPEEPKEPEESNKPEDADEPGRPTDRDRDRKKQWWLAAAGIAALGLAWWGWQAQGGSGEGRTPSQAASGFFEAQRTGDCDRLLDLLTEDSWSQGGEWSEREFLDRCEAALVGYRPIVEQVELEVVDDRDFADESGDRARVALDGRPTYEDPTGRMVRDGGEWRVETDPDVFVLGRSIDDTLRGYVDAYNAGDCDALRSFLAEATWSLEGSLSEDEFAERCRAVVDDPAGRRPLVVRWVDPRSADEDHVDRRIADVHVVRSDDVSILDLDSAAAVFVREDLTWGFAGLAGASGTTLAEGPSGPEPVPTFDWLDLQDRLVDEIPFADELCMTYYDQSASHPDGNRPARSILREFQGCSAGVKVTLYRFGDDAAARAATEPMVRILLADRPPTADELAGVAPDEDPADLERYAAGYRPNVEAAVPGLADARGVQTSCSVDGCGGGQVFGVRDGVLVRVETTYGDPDLSGAAGVLQAQMERL